MDHAVEGARDRLIKLEKNCVLVDLFKEKTKKKITFFDLPRYYLGRHVRAESSVRSEHVSGYDIEGSFGVRRRQEDSIFVVQSGHLRDDTFKTEQISGCIFDARRYVEISDLSRSKMSNDTYGHQTRTGSRHIGH